MVTWQEVLKWTPDPLLEASRGLSDRRKVLVQVADDAATALKDLHSRGETADAARRSMSARVKEIDRLVADVSELMMATADASDGVDQVRKLVQDCVDQAAIDSLTISSDGSVPWKETTAQHPPARVPTTISNRPQAEALSAQVRRAVERARQVDADYAKRLRAVGDGTYKSRENHASPSQGLANLPKKGWSTAEVATWWNALDARERADIIRKHPEAIGNLDGIDMGSRDRANRALLPDMLHRAEQERDAAREVLDRAIRGGDDTEILRASSVWEKAKERVSDLEAVRKTISAGSDRRLVVLDRSGDRVKAAVAIGDVDHARHVATFVPGMTTTVHGSLDDYSRRMEALRTETADRAGISRRDVATIAWLGYEAPQDVDVVSTSKARAGAERLASFTEGIQSSRMSSGVGDPHQTVLGHSYGSTTAGLAVKQVREKVVDDLVMFGSPGSGVHDVREYSLSPGHAFVSAVPSGDAVQGIGPDGSFGRNPTKLDGVRHLSGDATGSSNYDRNISWWQPWDSFKNHSTYLDDNTKTLEDFARVVGGVK